MQLTTSKNISLKFTLYTFSIVFFFGIGVNIVFFKQWYGSEMHKLQEMKKDMPTPFFQERFGKRQQFQMPKIEEISFSQEIWDELEDSTILYNISSIEDQYLLFAKVGDTIKISNVTRLVDAQKQIIGTFFFLVLIFFVITYIISVIFVKSSLKNITHLVDYVKKLDIHNLHEPVPLSGPENDEIRIIGAALQKTLNTIKEQTDSLKDFVTHASHELKTPLMSLSSVIDLAHKTGNYEKSYTTAKQILTSINTLFETLLSITKWEYHNIQRSSLDVLPLINKISEDITKKYAHKNISYTTLLPDTLIVETNPDIFRIIFVNLLENAFKYTPNNGTVSLSIIGDTIAINNSGPGISPEHSKSIRQKFWKDHSQAHKKEGFGLGLYLVQLLVSKHNWSIDMTSSDKEGTTFTLSLS